MNNNWQPVENVSIKNEAIRNAVLEQGFIKLPALTTDKIEELKAVYTKHHSIGQSGMFYSLYSKDQKYREQTHEEILAILEPVFEQYFTNYKSSFNLFIIKTAHTPEEFFIHQDPSYIDELKYSPLHVWIPLDTVNETNGALCIVPKSHRFFAPYRNISFDAPFETIRPFIRQYLEPVYMNAGELLVFDPRMLHNSLPNNSAETRVAVLCGLFPKEAEIISCYRDETVPDSPVEFYLQEEDFFLTYPDFFESCRMRPTVGKHIGETAFNIPAITEEQFAERCRQAGVKPRNLFKVEEVPTCNMFGEPVSS